MKQIIKSIIEAWQTNESVMLVTIYEQHGSTPRGIGAQMLVGRNGLITGTIGGGSIEKNAIDLAIASLDSRKSFTKDFELNLSDSSLNMVCGGGLNLHFLYMDKELFEDEINAINSRLDKSQVGFMVIDTVANKIECSDLAVHTKTVFSIAIPVPDRVIIFGGGHVAQSLVPVLSNVGFDCTVMESRKEFANRFNFPDAKEVIHCDYKKLSDYITLNPTDYLVVMTHGHANDFDVLEQGLRSDYAYVGVMGSRRKAASVNERLRNAGITEERIQAVHTPIGLSIGAVTPEEIAISVAAELIRTRAVIRGQSGEKVCPANL